MINKLFSIFDSKVETYSNPFVMRSSGEALRAFIDEASNPNSSICKHKADYTLFEIGDYNDETGRVTMLVAYKSLGIASELAGHE